MVLASVRYLTKNYEDELTIARVKLLVTGFDRQDALRQDDDITVPAETLGQANPIHTRGRDQSQPAIKSAEHVRRQVVLQHGTNGGICIRSAASYQYIVSHSFGL